MQEQSLKNWKNSYQLRRVVPPEERVGGHNNIVIFHKKNH